MRGARGIHRVAWTAASEGFRGTRVRRAAGIACMSVRSAAARRWILRRLACANWQVMGGVWLYVLCILWLMN